MSDKVGVIETPKILEIEIAIEDAVKAGKKSVDSPEGQLDCFRAIVNLTKSMGSNPPDEITVSGIRYGFGKKDTDFYKRMSQVIENPKNANVLEIQGALQAMFLKGESWNTTPKGTNEYYMRVAWHDAAVEFQSRIYDMGLDLSHSIDSSPI